MRLNKFALFLLAFLLMLAPCPSFGQQPVKRPLMESDYALWGKVELESISDSGNWISYYMMYDSGHDTLFVENTSKAVKYAFPNAHTGRFTKELFFVCKAATGGMEVLDLITGKEQVFPKASDAALTADAKFLLTLSADPKILSISTIAGIPLLGIPNIDEWTWNNAKSALACSYEENGIRKVGIIDFNATPVRILEIVASQQRYSSLKWSTDGDAVAFYGQKNGTHSEQLYHYSIKKNKLHTISAELTNGFPEGMMVRESYLWPLRLSKDGTKVFFAVANADKKNYMKGESDVQLWYGSSARPYPLEHSRDTLAYGSDLAIWLVDSNTVANVTERNDTYMMLAGNDDFAIIGDTRKYAPNYKFDDDMDLYLLDIKTGNAQLIAEEVSAAPAQTALSSDGMFLIYYKDADWWSYSVEAETSRNLTAGLHVSWDKREYDPGNRIMVYGVAGFTKHQDFIMYDRYDIWRINAVTGSAKRLTNGRELQHRYRIPRSQGSARFNYSGINSTLLDLSTDVLLDIFSFTDSGSGVAFYNERKGVHAIKLRESKISGHKYAATTGTWAAVEERYDMPPQIIIGSANKAPMVKTQSNRHHKNFEWGSSKLFSYSNTKGTPLEGVLYFPPEFDSAKHYPMIVYIYEQLSQSLHEYVNPTLHGTIGFNITNLLAKGYVVMTPDIVYEKGEPALSALDCVTSAVGKVLEIENVDKKRVGLFGHSFGGYQANFIVSNSKLFATAVSGGGISDLISFSLYMKGGWSEPDILRVENQQFRMQKSIYEDLSGYLANSALYHAAKIETPLLLFAGAKDDNVPHHQTAAFYYALRRLKKEVVMLLYPTEGHINQKAVNSSDLTHRVEDWFDYYLKGDKTIEWIAREANR